MTSVTDPYYREAEEASGWRYFVFFITMSCRMCVVLSYFGYIAPLYNKSLFFSAPLGSILRKHGISFHCYADDCQIYIPLKHNSFYSIHPLLECLSDIKAWMSLNFLSFNEKKKKKNL